MMVSRKTHRLDTSHYIGAHGYFITIVTNCRKPVFAAEIMVDECLKILEQHAEIRGFDVIAYCFMPDHLHLLVQGKNPDSNLINFVKNYKQITGYRYKQESRSTLWQKSFYDHILRQTEDVTEAVKYILANPVRKQLVERAKDYPYSGSLVYGLDIFEW